MKGTRVAVRPTFAICKGSMINKLIMGPKEEIVFNGKKDLNVYEISRSENGVWLKGINDIKVGNISIKNDNSKIVIDVESQYYYMPDLIYE